MFSAASFFGAELPCGVRNDMDKKTTKKKWRRGRHSAIQGIARVAFGPFCSLRYGIRPERFREQGERAYLVLMNHQTAFDQFFVGMSFRGALYYIATEDIFSMGWVSSLIRWLVAPIPIKKQTTDMAAVMNCFRVAREGGTIVMAPEGNRTYSGRTVHMNPAVATLARKLKMPVALYRIEGGYGVQPRWSDCVRKGRMRSYVSRVIEPEELAALSNEELLRIIEAELYVDEGTADARFVSKKRAEYLERAMYVCPFCGLSEFESRGCEIECKKCGRRILYGEDKTLEGVGFSFPFRFVTEWYDYQEAQISALDVTAWTERPLYREKASLSEVIVYKRKHLLRKECAVSLYGDRVVIDEGSGDAIALPFDRISAAAVLGRNKLNLYHEGGIYQIKGGKRFNALKYVNVYYRHRDITKGDGNGKFLGL